MDTQTSPLLDTADDFFPPVQGDAVDALIGQHNAAHRDIATVAEMLSGPAMQRATEFFIQAHREELGRVPISVIRLFDRDKAFKALDATYWQRALELTGVLDWMPQERRQQWHEQIRNMDTPPFTEEIVRDNLMALMGQRMDFLSEMVDGLFRGLSGQHVTNRPEGFAKRMIIDDAFDAFGSSYRKAGYIHDLRSIVARFMHREQPDLQVTLKALQHFRRDTGVWHDMDGGAFRVRTYKKGTAHLEVHPDFAYRLNQILAHRHPMAIPSHFRQPPKRSKQTVKVFNQPIPFSVLSLLANNVPSRLPPAAGKGWSFQLPTYQVDKHRLQVAGQVLKAIGGVFNRPSYHFDYDPTDVIGYIVATGMMPDQRSHQFYPTPTELAELAVEAAAIAPGHRCLEPSAGQGDLAEHMPADQTLCIELSQLHCQVLQSKGLETRCQDFLAFNEGAFDRIVMNPPFSVGRAREHLRHALTLLAPGGRLVAILPASMAGEPLPPEFQPNWSEIHANKFAGTSAKVVILTAEG
ncbi:DUF4942 domain-containing protein [Salinisphaera sp. P385]|uniref:DUF4942 domain-containing protein n=1 Tax=Spectribacter acetivorans TaxID=3075603 RepID=A0ABU3B8E8_9GAMM|nr:DUF4942 domain-containing protein [Salinisphaera sp. P385]MDT0618509.1 DUF4942 domain-containing protein [Salinisphaera sp. P385]